MKKSLYFTVGVIGLLALFVLLWTLRGGRIRPVEQSYGDHRDKGEDLQKKAVVPTPPDADHANPFSNNAPAADRIAQWTQFKNKPINYWGKVEDQNGLPLAGVQVQLRTRKWEGGQVSGIAGSFQLFETSTDAEGLFHLLGEAGDILEIKEIQKEGYRLSPKAERTRIYDGQTPSPSRDNPVVFRMWKAGAAEPLLTFQKNMRIPYDGTPVLIDLMKGEVLPGSGHGDVHITLWRASNARFGGKTPYDWTATIEVPHGGILRSDDEFMYRAPEIGYQPSVEIAMPASNPSWSHRMKEAYYIKIRDSVYGRMDVEFRTDSQQEKTGFSILAVWNTSGSRNLESSR